MKNPYIVIPAQAGISISKSKNVGKGIPAGVYPVQRHGAGMTVAGV